MEVNQQELRKRYQNSSTDELLQIKISSELTDIAKSLLEEELSLRDFDNGDIKYAENAQAALKADRESVKRDMSRRIQRVVIILLLIAIMAIYFEFLQ